MLVDMNDLLRDTLVITKIILLFFLHIQLINYLLLPKVGSNQSPKLFITSIPGEGRPIPFHQVQIWLHLALCFMK